MSDLQLPLLVLLMCWGLCLAALVLPFLLLLMMLGLVVVEVTAGGRVGGSVHVCRRRCCAAVPHAQLLPRSMDSARTAAAPAGCMTLQARETARQRVRGCPMGWDSMGVSSDAATAVVLCVGVRGSAVGRRGVQLSNGGWSTRNLGCVPVYGVTAVNAWGCSKGVRVLCAL